MSTEMTEPDPQSRDHFKIRVAIYLEFWSGLWSKQHKEWMFESRNRWKISNMTINSVPLRHAKGKKEFRKRSVRKFKE